MPRIANEEGFCHVMTFAFFFQLPQNRRILFWGILGKSRDRFENGKSTENEYAQF